MKTSSTGKSLMIAGGVTFAVPIILFVAIAVWANSYCASEQYECGANWLVVFSLFPCIIACLVGIGLFIAGIVTHFASKSKHKTL